MNQLEDIYKENKNLIWSIYHKLKPNVTHMDRDDWFQVGSIGLIKAIKTYDAEKGFSFSTFAWRIVENEMLMELRKYTAKKRSNDLPDISINTPITETSTIEDVLQDMDNLEDMVINNEMKKEIAYSLPELLTTREAKILASTLIGYSQSEIARQMSISQAQVSRILNKTIIKVRNLLIQ